MSGVFQAIPAAMTAFAAAHHATGATVVGAGTADSEGMLAAAAAALGPIGAVFLAAYGPAQANNLAATLLLGHVHHAIGGGTDTLSGAFVASDLA